MLKKEQKETALEPITKPLFKYDTKSTRHGRNGVEKSQPIKAQDINNKTCVPRTRTSDIHAGRIFQDNRRQARSRQERESCLNNVNLNLNHSASGFPKEKSRQQQQQQQQSTQRRPLDRTYSKKTREKFLKGSLENVSSNPFGEFDISQSTLRRSRSLAISRETLFTSLDIPTTSRQRRAQLIPRAKLIDRSSLKERYLIKERTPTTNNHDPLQTNDRPIIRRKSSISSDYAVPQVNHQNPQKGYQSSATAIRRQCEETVPPYSQTVGGGGSFPSVNATDIDNSDQNPYSNKSSLHGIFRIPGGHHHNDEDDDLNYSVDFGLSLPNYYPDSKCDTDISLTDISFADNISIREEIQREPSSKKTSSRDNLSTNNLFYRESSSPESAPDNILYHENISFGKGSLDEKYGTNSRPKTIREYSPYYQENGNFYEGKPRSLPNYTTTFHDSLNYDENEENIYDIVEKPEDNAKIYEELGEISGGETKDSDFSQSDLNFDEINLNNDNITKVVEEEIGTPESSGTCFENNPIYDEIPYSPDRFVEFSLPEIAAHYDREEQIEGGSLKTCVQVQSDEGIYSLVQRCERDKSSEYKTVVSVEQKIKREESPKEGRRHSHNYLREFLETQKGSRKPLQNFLSKKISRAFGDAKKVSEESNLVNNQYHSLPDLSVGKNLQQCEKIDRKLRKCEKVPNLSRPSNSNNRFIVNIGRHFDVTAESNIPVDFEVKISKIPKLRKSKSGNSKNAAKSSENKQQVFIEAVKNLNETLNNGLSVSEENRDTSKPQVIEVTAKTKNTSNIKRLNPPKYKKKQDQQRSEAKTEKPKLKPLPKISEVAENKDTEEVEMNPELLEKLDTMRSYWGKIAKQDLAESEEKSEESQSKCKIVDVQTKVEDVIRKFEPKEEKEVEKPESIVTVAKQIFEPKISQEKPEKRSPFVKESCEFFENPFFDKCRFNNNSNQFESLNPNVVEIIEKDEKQNEVKEKPCVQQQKSNQQKLHANFQQYHNLNAAKSKPKTRTEAEFDHVRYRVMKSDLFQKNIFANCQKESQFDGLMQYLQDYSFQELLIDNNIVIIEPIRSSVPHEASPNAKASRNITKLLHKSQNGNNGNQNPALCRRFFYHPVRVNKEMNEDELPNPDTVKLVRQLFEAGLKKSQSSQDLDKLSKKTVQYQTVDPDKDNCSATDSNSNPSNASEIGSNDNLYDNELCCSEQQYVSEDILKKIRECGTSVTYYGGRVLNKKNTKVNPMTKTIMEEIRGEQSRECNCKKNENGTAEPTENNNKDTYHGIKFKLLKSNSCSSRLELVGTENLSEYRQKFLEKQKYLIDQKNRENQRKNSLFNEEKEENYIETVALELKRSADAHNENVKREQAEREESNAPKIIATTGKKMTQWGSAADEKTYNSITFNKPGQKTNYNYHNYEKVKNRTKKGSDMEFEAYEIAGS